MTDHDIQVLADQVQILDDPDLVIARVIAELHRRRGVASLLPPPSTACALGPWVKGAYKMAVRTVLGAHCVQCVVAVVDGNSASLRRSVGVDLRRPRAQWCVLVDTGTTPEFLLDGPVNGGWLTPEDAAAAADAWLGTYKGGTRWLLAEGPFPDLV